MTNCFEIIHKPTNDMDMQNFIIHNWSTLPKLFTKVSIYLSVYPCMQMLIFRLFDSIHGYTYLCMSKFYIIFVNVCVCNLHIWLISFEKKNTVILQISNKQYFIRFHLEIMPSPERFVHICIWTIYVYT